MLACDKPRCRYSRTPMIVRRQDHDPPTAVKMIMRCPDHIESGEFEQVAYIDAAGNEIWTSRPRARPTKMPEER
jgi:hypothetical protein